MTIKCYLNDPQFKLISEEAERLGLSISSFLKMSALKSIRPKDNISTQTKISKADKLVDEYREANPKANVYREGNNIVVDNGNSRISNPIPPSYLD